MRLANAAHAAIVLAAIAVAATPAHALKPPPKDVPASSSGGSSGGSGTPVTEPSSLILFGAGTAAFMIGKRRKQRG